MAGTSSVTVTSALVAVAAVGGLAVIAKYIHTRLTAVKKVAILKKIIMYPFKSLQGIELEGAECTEEGLRYRNLKDRQFMLIDERGKSITFWEEPTLVLVRVWYEDPDLCIDADNMRLLRLPLLYNDSDSDKIYRVKMWIHEVEGVDCGDEAAEWFQKYLGKPGIRVLRFLRYLDAFEDFGKGRYNLKSFHYCVTYHLLSEASMSELNSKVEENATFRNFRPNFVVGDCNAHDEDYWKLVHIGEEVVMNFTERCYRCTGTNVNPETGTRNSKDPYSTLRKYRMPDTKYAYKKYRASPLFGVLLSQKKGGTLFVGDSVMAQVNNKPLV